MVKVTISMKLFCGLIEPLLAAFYVEPKSCFIMNWSPQYTVLHILLLIFFFLFLF